MFYQTKKQHTQISLAVFFFFVDYYTPVRNRWNGKWEIIINWKAREREKLDRCSCMFLISFVRHVRIIVSLFPDEQLCYQDKRNSLLLAEWMSIYYLCIACVVQSDAVYIEKENFKKNGTKVDHPIWLLNFSFLLGPCAVDWTRESRGLDRKMRNNVVLVYIYAFYVKEKNNGGKHILSFLGVFKFPSKTKAKPKKKRRAPHANTQLWLFAGSSSSREETYSLLLLLACVYRFLCALLTKGQNGDRANAISYTWCCWRRVAESNEPQLVTHHTHTHTNF